MSQRVSFWVDFFSSGIWRSEKVHPNFSQFRTLQTFWHLGFDNTLSMSISTPNARRFKIMYDEGTDGKVDPSKVDLVVTRKRKLEGFKEPSIFN
ncbi:hypothetical protein NQ315_005095 [Exocentrus adspersus]|uniref:Uncharacterized protein n=1 Tax=Exocentrus adspersus TaxID=1586481 RepID=A0AAV8VTP3_9CUCU|nr:hypothetical protein NQ315_005095 [Exocentrus adspersus]